jgi:hypothetical protein
MVKRFVAALVLVLVGVSLAVADWKPPHAKPQRRKGGEAFPPLPLPATPVRRTEKKREPSPPTLICRVIHGKEPRQIKYEGETYTFWDWNTNAGAEKNLLRKLTSQLGQPYNRVAAPLSKLSGDPAEVPILFISGHEDITFDAKELAFLKKYAESGGYLWLEACCGSEKAYKEYHEMLKAMWPDRKVYVLPEDHPLYCSYYNISEVKYTKEATDRTDGKPYIEGLDIGCRTAVLLFKYGISNGWDEFHDPGAKDYEIADSYKLGVNMIAYSLAYHNLGKFLSRAKQYYEQAKEDKGDFVFGQVVYEGNWDPNPSSAINLLMAVDAKSSVRVKFKRENMDLDKTDLFECPFLYLTGHEDFKLTDQQATKLRNYLNGGGFLLADSCCGRASFAAAFIREIKKVLPGAEIKHLPADHAVYSSRFKISSVNYSEFTKKAVKDLPQLPLYGIEVAGSTRVIFCPYALGNGWEKEEHPFTKALEAEDALKLGVNIVVYSQTH